MRLGRRGSVGVEIGCVGEGWVKEDLSKIHLICVRNQKLNKVIQETKQSTCHVMCQSISKA